MFLLPIKFMPLEEYLNYLNFFGLVVTYSDGGEPKFSLPAFLDSTPEERELVLDYLEDSEAMNRIITTSVQRYSRIIDTALDMAELEAAERWKASYSNLCFFKESYNSGKEIFINRTSFRKK